MKVELTKRKLTELMKKHNVKAHPSFHITEFEIDPFSLYYDVVEIAKAYGRKTKIETDQFSYAFIDVEGDLENDDCILEISEYFGLKNGIANSKLSKTPLHIRMATIKLCSVIHKNRFLKKEHWSTEDLVTYKSFKTIKNYPKVDMR